MWHPLLFLFGSRRILVSEEWAEGLLGILGREGLAFREPVFGEGRFSVRCGLFASRRLFRIAEKEGLAPEEGEILGFPALLWQCGKRPGILAGLLLFSLLLFFSGRVVWSVRVEGCRRLNEEEVIEALSECGLSVGTPLSRIYTPALENRVLLLSEDIAWISINMRGTVARAVIREVSDSPEEESEAMAANLVARRDGVIAYFEDLRGNPAVEVGDRVAKGDLLVGGIYAKERGPLRVCRAEGRVMARTERSFSVRIPLVYEKKEYTGEEWVEKYLIFFKKDIKFFENSGNEEAICDTIETIELYGQKEDAPLPLGIRTLRHLSYRTVEMRREREEAERMAYDELALLMDREVPDGALLQKRVWSEVSEEELILFCEAVYLEDIAEPVTIEIEGKTLPRR